MGSGGSIDASQFRRGRDDGGWRFGGLLWIRGTDTTAVYELRGPATDYNCEDEIKLLKRDAHVLDLKVLRPDSGDLSETVGVRSEAREATQSREV